MVRLRGQASEQAGTASSRDHRVEVESIVSTRGSTHNLDYPAADTNRRDYARGEWRNKRSRRTTSNCSEVARVSFESRRAGARTSFRSNNHNSAAEFGPRRTENSVKRQRTGCGATEHNLGVTIGLVVQIGQQDY